MNKDRAYLYTAMGALREVFQSARFVALAVVTSAVIFVLAVWLPNLGLIARVIGDSGIPLATKVQIPINFLGSIRTNFSVLSASYTIAIAILFGINLAMIAYYIQKRKNIMREAGVAAHFGGFMSGVLGVGCAACGSFILSALGAAGAVALLPLKGAEFGILSVGLLGVSLFSLSRKIKSPMICKPENSREK